MTPYFSTSGKKSGVKAFEIGTDFIIVQFDKKQYTYPESLNRKSLIDEMKSLALNSKGLSTFISQNRDILEFI